MTTKKSSLAAREASSRKAERTGAPYENSSFETHVLTTLESQDRILEHLRDKLERPVLNGGFDDLVKKVDKIETVTEKLSENQALSGKKIDAIHVAVYDPDTGLYGRVKEHTQVITRTSKGLMWFVGVVITAALAGGGKMLYDFLAGHIHFSP